MEAATSQDAARKLEGDKAQRIIAAMRASVGQRGAAASTFDHVAREAGVSRGLLHYYFGSKERLLVEVVRHDAPSATATWTSASPRRRARTRSSQALVVGLEEFLEDDAGGQAVIYEMLSASRHSEEIRAELAELYRQWRERLAGWLRDEGARGRHPAPGRARGGRLDPVLARRRLRHPGAVRSRTGTSRPRSTSAWLPRAGAGSA